MSRKKSSASNKAASTQAVIAEQSPIFRLLSRRWVQQAFAVASLFILLVTSVFWAFVTARLHETNADQFIDAYLFESQDTFSSALFPGAHTFLFKWPIFALMHSFGHQTEVFLVATVLMVLATVGLLAYLLYKINPRPVVFGLLCLCLSGVLLLVPGQPYPGAPLPTNFAMTTTRNLEYALFVLCIFLFARNIHLKRIGYWVLAFILALVVASDKLFGVLALGSAMLVLAAYYIFRRKQELHFARNWLWLSIASVVLGQLLLLLLSRLEITHIVSESQASPFPLITSLKQLAEGLWYGVMAVLTNFGANPVHAVVIVRETPAALVKSLTSPVLVSYLFNLMLLGFAVFATGKVILSKSQDAAARLTVILSAATLTALAVFVLTDHYYPVDARYLAIELFALFVGLAAYLRGKVLRLQYVVPLAVVLVLIVLPLGMHKTWQDGRAGEVARSSFSKITRMAASVIDTENIQRLIGDYWDITPIKPQTKNNVAIAPVNNCNVPQPALNSLAWFKKTENVPSAFLAVRDPGKSTYDGCSLAQLAVVYGTPSKRVLLAPNPNPPYDPDALLLVYADGPQPLAAKQPETKPSGLPAPRTVSSLREKNTCSSVSLNVIAHQDDDLLFMNPDVDADIQSGVCLRTVYLTAGDAGEASAYWNSRELGAKAAYAEMYKVPDVWHDDSQLLNGRFVTVSYLESIPQLQLVFFRLPDGNLRGEGFAGTKNQSLQSLLNGQLPVVRTVDTYSDYSREQLINSLKELIRLDDPMVIRTLGADDPALGDHSDHHAVGMLVKLATEGRQQAASPLLYSGYPMLGQPVNLPEALIAAKQNTFMAYAQHDGAVCQSVAECTQLITYGSYLTRLYKAGQTQETGFPLAP